MAVSLYDISVRSYLQALAAVAGFLDKGSAWCSGQGIDPESIVETRLIDDMLPFRFQIVSVAHHSLGAIRGLQSGRFGPPPSVPDEGYAALQRRLGEARAELEALAVDEVNALAGRDVVFEIGDRKIPFVAEDFVLSFSLPNVHFHAATAYDILRMKGAPLGKRDYLGQLRTKG